MPPKRRRYHGLYFHSSPPKILPMNGNTFAGRQRDEVNDGFVVKPSNIRIWIHDKDIGKLTRVLWAGQGNRLRTEASTNPRVRRFLENVPYFMNVIKSVHQAVIDNDLELLQNKLDDPPPALVTTKDANGLSVMHKAAGLGHTKIVEYLIKIWPNGVSTIDATGKTPLHWAASAKDNIRIYNLLVQTGSYEDTMDYRMKVPQYYRMKPQEIDKSFLYVVPDAPRVPQYTQPDWSTLVDDIGRLEGSAPKFYYPESRRNSDAAGNSVNLLTSDTIINGIDNISEPDFYNREDSNNDNSSTIDIESNKNSMELTNGNIPNGKIPNGNITPPISPALSDSNELNNNDSSKNNDDFDELNGNIDDVDDGNLDKNDEFVLENDKTEDKSIEDDKSNDVKSNDDNSNDDKSDDDDNKSEANNDASDIEDTLDTKDEENDETNNEMTDDIETNEALNKEDNAAEEPNEELKKENEEVNEDEEEETEKLNENVENSTEKTEKDKAENKDQVEEMKEESDRNESDEVIEDIEIIENNDSIDEVDDKIDGKMENDENELLSNDQKSNNIAESDERDDKNSNVEIENHIKNNDKNNKEEEVDNDDDESEDDDDDQTLDVGKPPNINNIDIDENHVTVNKSTSSGSPSPPLEIEGLIQGEADDNQVQSQSAEIDDDTKIKSIIETGDMEQLALIVLNGEGNKLIDTKSNQPEIQAFLDNVPAYMNKIRRVHEAAREGNLRDLQSALDRRKFAIAKDEISPNGATPLHVATVFGHAGIVRYLAGRFPETTTAVDENGRTALHYAATINDNGHFYNLLTNFGSNSKATDKLGNIPDFYKNQDQSKDILGHKQLLKNFGANESLEEAMLSDQVNEYIEIPIFKTEQGRYLATSKWLNFLKLKQPLNLNSALGDPLIKALTEIVENRPTDPVLYLTEFLQNYIRTRDQKEINNNNSNNMARISNTRDIQNIENGLNSLDIDENDNDFGNIPSQYQQSSNTAISTAIKSEPQKQEQDNGSGGDNDSNSTSPPSEDRDEHGQSMLHFACARTHGRNALFNLIGESNIDITYRDELYRTARDVALQANQAGNAKEIDRYVVSLAALGETKPFEYFLTAGYDHILDATDDSGNTTIFDVARSRGHTELHNYLEKFHEFEEIREELHQAIRDGNFEKVQELTAMANAILLIKAKNYYGRTSLHIGILREHEEIVEYLVNTCPDALKIGDNLERMPLHYAMGIASVEIISRILIRKGAQRTVKDLKGRQPSYYFMNKADILRLQEEEGAE